MGSGAPYRCLRDLVLGRSDLEALYRNGASGGFSAHLPRPRRLVRGERRATDLAVGRFVGRRSGNSSGLDWPANRPCRCLSERCDTPLCTPPRPTLGLPSTHGRCGARNLRGKCRRTFSACRREYAEATATRVLIVTPVRVRFYSPELGSPVSQIHPSSFGGGIFSLDCPDDLVTGGVRVGR